MIGENLRISYPLILFTLDQFFRFPYLILIFLHRGRKSGIRTRGLDPVILAGGLGLLGGEATAAHVESFSELTLMVPNIVFGGT